MTGSSPVPWEQEKGKWMRCPFWTDCQPFSSGGDAPACRAQPGGTPLGGTDTGHGEEG